MENDALEELFRKKADEHLSQEKPREVVWQKIESNLKSKAEIPKKHFIQSVWFSAAVFALIAVPYFYFFIENIGNNEQESNFVKTSLPDVFNEDKLIEPIVLDSVLSEDPIEVVKVEHQPIKVIEKIKPSQPKKIKKEIVSSKEINQSKPFQLDTLVPVLASADINLPKTVNEPVSKTVTKDTVLLAANASAPVLAKTIKNTSVPENKASNTQQNKIEPIQIYRNRFVLQDKVNRVGFNFIRKANNKLIFENTALRISIIRENGVVKIIANPNRINKDVLLLLQNNKERIYNYYINFDKPAS